MHRVAYDIGKPEWAAHDHRVVDSVASWGTPGFQRWVWQGSPKQVMVRRRWVQKLKLVAQVAE